MCTCLCIHWWLIHADFIHDAYCYANYILLGVLGYVCPILIVLLLLTQLMTIFMHLMVMESE